MSENQKHPYHLVDPSPWPLVTSISALILAWGFIQFMHEEKTLLFYVGSIAVGVSCILWWRDVIVESEQGGFHNKVVQIGLRYGMIFFIASEFLIYAVHTETLDFVYYHFSTMRYIKLTFYVGKFPKIQIYG